MSDSLWPHGLYYTAYASLITQCKAASACQEALFNTKAEVLHLQHSTFKVTPRAHIQQQQKKYMKGFSRPALGVAHLIFAHIPVQGKLENAFSLCSKKEGEKRLVIGWQSLPKKGRLEVKLSPGLKCSRLGTLTFRRCLALSAQNLSTNSGKTVFQRTYRMSGLEKKF